MGAMGHHRSIIEIIHAAPMAEFTNQNEIQKKLRDF
jgi:hypothetical protein